ncbi:hypothetical protein Q1695_002598 [Nippostrongylus brasiliensis]|nr:hypothetical protein Q1695_002598 [Nippostrongylus brasiliensis]
MHESGDIEDPGTPMSDVEDDMKKAATQHRALPIRIKSMYKCEERRVVPMAPPFRGFSVFVRFQCRARLHNVETIKMKDFNSPVMHKSESNYEA